MINGMGNIRWRFQNRNNSEAVVIVEGETSARVLWSILRNQAADWIVEEYRATAIAEPKSKAAEPMPEETIADPDLPPSIYLTEKRNGKRRFSRYNLEFQVVLVSGNRTFRTHSNDISVGGMQLKRCIPQSMLNQDCRIFVTTPRMNEKIELHCRIVGDPANPCRLKFTDTDTALLKKLELWIMEAQGKSAPVAA